MAMVVRAFPLKPDCSRQDVEDFAAQLQGARRSEVAAMHQSHGVVHESWYLQQTPGGYWVIAIDQVEGDVGQSALQFAQANGDFVGWFKQRVLELTGIDTSQTPLGPPTVPVYEWSANEQVAALLQPYQGA